METTIDGKLNPKFRMIVLGSKKVGKTSIINQMVNNTFRSEYYPTKDLVIYKELYNFTPKSGDFDDFCYIEFIDTMAYDRSKKLKDFSEFFLIHLIKERDISKTNLTSKIPENIIKNIKHEYVTGKESSSKGLFSNDKIMAYLFVFDYEDDESLNDVLELYYAIVTDETIRTTDESQKTIKCFICNKYPIIIDETPINVPYPEIINGFMEKDRRTSEIIAKIQKRLVVREKATLNAKDITFFTSTKYNLGIKNCFNSVYNKIKHKEDLWKKITFENKQHAGSESEKEKEEDEYINNNDDEIQTGFLCCKKMNNNPNKKNQHKQEEKKLLQNNDNSKMRNNSFQEKLNFKDDEEDVGYDMNVRIKPKTKEIYGKKEEDEKKEGGCIVY